MNGLSNDYIALKLYKARQQELAREAKHDQLVNIALKNIALKKVRLTMQLPRIKIGKN